MFSIAGGHAADVPGTAQAGIIAQAPCAATSARAKRAGRPRSAPQVFLLIVMVGNFAEKSLDCCATFTATLRAMSR